MHIKTILALGMTALVSCDAYDWKVSFFEMHHVSPHSPVIEKQLGDLMLILVCRQCKPTNKDNSSDGEAYGMFSSEPFHVQVS